jgi:hypothetical protein
VGTEAAAQLSVSTLAPWLQWVAVQAGPALRSSGTLEPGAALSTSLTMYLRPYLSLSARYEHDWWRDSGQANLVGVTASFYLVHAREVTGFKYP